MEFDMAGPKNDWGNPPNGDSVFGRGTGVVPAELPVRTPETAPDWFTDSAGHNVYPPKDEDEEE
jgi:hypothetical protein